MADRSFEDALREGVQLMDMASEMTPAPSESCALRLLQVGDKRIDVIKAIRISSGLGLKEAMALETAVRNGDPIVVVEGSYEKVTRAAELFADIGSGVVIEVCKASEVADRERQLSEHEQLVSHLRMARDLAIKQGMWHLDNMLAGALSALEQEDES
jgi:ribosomal protein L7/L12